MSWHFDGDDKGVSLKRTPDMPKWRDIPKAGIPWKGLPPPLVEGQEIDYRFYDDMSMDMEVRGVAVRLDGELRWATIHRAAPRAMIGTQSKLQVPLELLAKQKARQVALMREQWMEHQISARLGQSLRFVAPETIKEILALEGLKVERKVFPDREELWINGEFDSVFWPCGRPEEKEKYRFTSCYQSPIV